MRTYADLINDATKRLSSKSETPRLDAEVLLRHITGFDRTQMFLALREPVADSIVQRMNELVTRREECTPVAYLVGTREFMGMPFSVAPGVLVPRPETELLVEWVLEEMAKLDQRPARVVDVGAGSGAIAISIAANATTPVAVTAIEPSEVARSVITTNADSLLSPEQRSLLHIEEGDLLTTAPGPWNVVVANLPYLTPAQIDGNPDLAAEPRLALDGGPAGLDLIERLITQLPDRLAPTFAVGLEIDPSQANPVREHLAATLQDADIEVIRDYAGLDRHVVATQQPIDFR